MNKYINDFINEAVETIEALNEGFQSNQSIAVCEAIAHEKEAIEEAIAQVLKGETIH